MSWFADYNEGDYIEFFKERVDAIKKERKVSLGYYGDVDELFYMCRMALFGFAGKQVDEYDSHEPCYTICRIDNSRCSQECNSFCKVSGTKSIERPNYYRMDVQMRHIFIRKQKQIQAIIGENRFNSFIEHLADESIKRFDRYTRRERNEKDLVKPKEFDGGFVSLEAIQEDPWEIFRTNKIKQGDLGCLHFSDSLFSA